MLINNSQESEEQKYPKSVVLNEDVPTVVSPLLPRPRQGMAMSESTGSTLAFMAHASASEVSDIKHEHHGNISAINLIDSP